MKNGHERAEQKVIIYLAGSIPRFPDRQFVHSLRITKPMVDDILNNLA